MVKLTTVKKTSASKSVDTGFKKLDNEVNKLLSVINTSDINISYYFTCLNLKDDNNCYQIIMSHSSPSRLIARR